MKAKMFYDTEKAFVLKDASSLKRTVFLFRVINSPALVKFLSSMVKFGIRIGLPIKGLIRSTIFNQFCAGETLKESKEVVDKLYKANVKSILDYSVEGEENNASFDKNLSEIVKVIEMAAGNPAIPYTSVKFTGLVSSEILEKVGEKAALTESESRDHGLFMKRLEKLFDTAKLRSVPVYVDAEESWLQVAIDRITEDMMLKYNRQGAIVLTTLQMYRHDRLKYLEQLIDWSVKSGITLGIKLVRGAYIEKENRRAAEKGYASPIQPSKQRTDEDFDKALTLCLDNIERIMLCAGTHNEASTLFLLEEMKKRDLPNDHRHIYFSQLYGMSDHISMNLAAAKYNVTKYLPYGPVKAVVPYLLRRAEENTGIAGQMSRELDLVLQEKKRREKMKLLN